MKIQLGVLVVSVSLAIAACGEAPDDGGQPGEETEETGATFGQTSTSDGKDDDVGSRNLVWLNENGDDIPIDDVSYKGTAVVDLATTRDVKWRADRIVLHQRPNERLTISIDSDGWFTDVKQDIAFGLFYKKPGGEHWEQVAIPVVVDDQEAEIFIFERIAMDPEREAAEVDAIIPTNIGVLRESDKIPFEGFADDEFIWGVLPIPIGKWGDLEGEYPYVIEADCEGIACTKER